VTVTDTRASDAEREAVADRLRAASAEGRLEPDELDERVGRVYAARTHGELATVTEDLPEPVARVGAPGHRDPRDDHDRAARVRHRRGVRAVSDRGKEGSLENGRIRHLRVWVGRRRALDAARNGG
jgi:hypothetical protein